MEKSILKTIRKMLGPDADYDYYDDQLLFHINSAFATLCQVGVGPDSGFRVTGIEETWDDFTGDDKKLQMVVDYVYAKTKLIFDPPLTGSVLEALKAQAAEAEWRLGIAAER